MKIPSPYHELRPLFEQPIRHVDDTTIFAAVEPIVKYIPKSYRIWCPFDAEWSSFYQTFRENGFDVIRSHIDEGKDFFLYEPDDYDVIISNPPFNIKDQILERLYNLNKPFAVLLPLNTLQGKTRYKYFKNGIQILSFDQRIGFHNRQNMNFIYLLCQHTYGYFQYLLVCLHICFMEKHDFVVQLISP